MPFTVQTVDFFPKIHITNRCLLTPDDTLELLKVLPLKTIIEIAINEDLSPVSLQQVITSKMYSTADIPILEQFRSYLMHRYC
jgi:hypothetical protein